MSTEADILDIDPETLATLREAGIDPRAYLKRRAELRAWRAPTEEAAKLAAEQEELRPEVEAYNAFIGRNGLLADVLRNE